jgi:hypothetical protein
MHRLASLAASALACFGATLLVPSVARAQAVPPPDSTPTVERPADAPVSAFLRVGLRGFEIEAGGTIQSGGGSSPVQAPTLWGKAGDPAGALSPRGAILDPGGAGSIGQGFSPYAFAFPGLSLRVGYRLHPNVSVGAFFSLAEYYVTNGAENGDAPDGTGRLSRQQVTFGVYGRYYVTQLSRRIQPWGSIGLGISSDVASYSRIVGATTAGPVGGQPETGDYTLRQLGLVVPLAVGVDFRMAPIFSLGPMLGYAHVFPLQGCLEVVLDQYSPVPATNTCNAPPVENHGYDNLFAGIYAKVTIDPFTR